MYGRFRPRRRCGLLRAGCSVFEFGDFFLGDFDNLFDTEIEREFWLICSKTLKAAPAPVMTKVSTVFFAKHNLLRIKIVTYLALSSSTVFSVGIVAALATSDMIIGDTGAGV